MNFNLPGIYTIKPSEVEQVIRECKKNNCYIIMLPSGISSKNDFMNVIQNTCPLDPPMLYPNWDGLSDSLWSGLNDLCVEKIAIIWDNTELINKKDPQSFNIIVHIFNELCISLADPKITASFKTTKLYVFLIGNHLSWSDPVYSNN